MIAGASVVADLRTEWTGVVLMREEMKRLVITTFAFGALSAPGLRKVLYNLPLLLAFDVLKQVLLAARDEGRFASSRPQLGNLMEDARDALSWIDWHSLREGVRRRNEVAHDGALFDSEQCLKDIANVEAQLVEWRLIDPA